MRVLQLSLEPPFDARQVATGNAIRAAQLRTALEAAGHRVQPAWLARPGEQDPHSFASSDQLRRLLRAQGADVLLVGWWELLSLLPFEPELPVVLDFVAPRPLEELYEDPARMAANLHRLRANLARCDLLLVGNAEQERLLSLWLLEAGFDLRAGSPVRVVSLAGKPIPGSPPNPQQNGWTLVGGGVSWPWRKADAFFAEIRSSAAAQAGSVQLVLFDGSYPGAAQPGASAPEPQSWTLTPYQDYSAFLSSAHIGLELGEDNIERRAAGSFRSLDFLRHGLPLICSAGLPLAARIRAAQAGWVVESADELPALLETILADPADWRQRRANALSLVATEFDPDRAAAPLLDWLVKPLRPARLPGWGLPPQTPPVLGVPPWRERLARRYHLARRIALARWFNRDGAQPGTAIVIVSRGDLFPTDHGAAVKIVETARGLSRNGREVLLVTDDRRHYWRFTDGVIERLALPRWLKLLARPLAWVKLDHYTRELPESNAFLYLPLSDGNWFWRCLWVAGHHRAAVLQAEFPAYAHPCLAAAAVLDAKVVLVEHNVEYARLQAQVPELTPLQYQNLKDIEISLCNRAGAVVCVSDNDRLRLAADGVHPGLLHTIPHGVDLAAWRQAKPAAARERFGIPAEAPLLVFHGTFAYPPNLEALQVLGREILPRLEQAGIVAHALAVGHRPPAAPPHPRIHCTGSVEDVAPWLKAADLAVVPLRDGGGTRMKIIDCFAAGLPVVSTAKGIEGIPAQHGEEALIVDDWDSMAAAVARLLGEPVLAARLAAGGLALAAGLDWQVLGARYLEVYAGISR